MENAHSLFPARMNKHRKTHFSSFPPCTTQQCIQNDCLHFVHAGTAHTFIVESELLLSFAFFCWDKPLNRRCCFVCIWWLPVFSDYLQQQRPDKATWLIGTTGAPNRLFSPRTLHCFRFSLIKHCVGGERGTDWHTAAIKASCSRWRYLLIGATLRRNSVLQDRPQSV